MTSCRRIAVAISIAWLCSEAGGDDQFCNEKDDQCEPAPAHLQDCGLWFAKSTIPGAGLGMFAGKNFTKKQDILLSGEIVVPIVDLELHQGNDWVFLWDEYTWNAGALRMDLEGMDAVNAASPGFGSAANCFLDLKNVDEGSPEHSSAKLHRSKDPGAGAFTAYHNRKASASKRIARGQELFVSYGAQWFKSRVSTIGPVPIDGDLSKANMVLAKWKRLFYQLDMESPEEMLKDLWESFVWKNPYDNISRQLFAMPKTWAEVDQATGSSLTELRVNQSTLAPAYLYKHGLCADNLVARPSTVAQAGRGAFTTRFLPKGAVVSPLPLIHLYNRTRMDMYQPILEDGELAVNQTHLVGRQLLLNYCMGHRDSSVLLCPYSVLGSLINHSGENPNVELRWAQPHRSNHAPEWLNQTLDEIKDKTTAVLAMEVVALRDLEEGEEVFLNYGDEWQQAWDHHVANWEPTPFAEDYRSAEQMNQDTTTPLRTVFEQMREPYPRNVELWCEEAFDTRRIWRKLLELGAMDKFLEGSDRLCRCDLLRKETDDQGFVWYTAMLIDDDQDDDKKPNHRIMAKVPRQAFRFMDRPYTTDMHLPNAFRHDMRIPDELFPEKWKNRKGGKQAD